MTAAPDCSHTHQKWNIQGTHGYCVDCGAQFPKPADTETRVIVDLMVALYTLLKRCDLAEEAGSTNLSIASVRSIAAAAVDHANESAYPADPVSDSELSRRIAGEMARRSAVRSTP